METLQLVKEKLLLKTAEVKKHEVEKEKISEKIKSVLALNDKKIKELKNLVKEKEQAAIAAQSATDKSYSSQEPSSGGKEAEGKGTSSEGRSGAEPTIVKEIIKQDPMLLKELEALRKKDQELTNQIKKETIDKDKFKREKALLLKEMRRLKKDPDTLSNLKEQIESLNGEVKKMKDRSLDTANNLEKLLMEKDEVIASYEKMLYGETEADQEGMLPFEIIEDLKKELKERLEEKKMIVAELEEIKGINAELELKISLTEETSTSDRLDAGARQDSRVALSAEFSGSLEGFLVTYSDMITLLLVVFVLMFSMSKLDEAKLAEALSSFQEKKVRATTSTNMRLTKAEMLMMSRVKELVKDNVDPDSIVRSDTRTILKRLPTSELFGPGSAELVEGAEKLIEDAIKEDMIDGVKQVIVDGHTDDIPIKSAKFPSNWELSTARASRVARFIVDKMRYPAKFIAVSGYGPHRPMKPNTNDFNRGLNRRVEVKILKDREFIKEGQKDLVPEEKKAEKVKTDKNGKPIKIDNKAKGKKAKGLGGLAKSPRDTTAKKSNTEKTK